MNSKKCPKCNRLLALEQFYKNSRMKDGRFRVCRDCVLAYYKELYRRHPARKTKANERCRLHYERNKERELARNKKYRAENDESIKKSRRKKYENNPKRYMLNSARYRARLNDLAFDLKESDITIPKQCPICSVELIIGNRVNKEKSPSLDKIIPDRGYVPNNTVVICYRCNRIKYNASPQELINMGNFYIQLMSK